MSAGAFVAAVAAAVLLGWVAARAVAGDDPPPPTRVCVSSAVFQNGHESQTGIECKP